MSPAEQMTVLQVALLEARAEVERTGKPVQIGVFFMGMPLVLFPQGHGPVRIEA